MIIPQSNTGIGRGAARWLRVALLGCVLAIHCFLGQARAQDPARWEEAVRAYAAEDARSPPPDGAIVFIGSSSIVFWKTIHEDMAPLTIISRGFGGSTMGEALYWLDSLALKYKPRAVVIYEGDNDIGYYNATPEEVLADFTGIASRVRERLPETRIYFLSIKPSILRWARWPEMRRANELIRRYCESSAQLYFVDIASGMFDAKGQPRADIFLADGLHMNGMGYSIWTSNVKQVLLLHEAAFEPEVGALPKVIQ